MDWFIGLLLGHLAGDYVLQNSWMALNKRTYLSICAIHCLIYTLCVCGGLYIFDIQPSLLLLTGIFASHFILDSTNFVQKWMKFYGITHFIDCIPHRENYKHKRVPELDATLRASQVIQTAFGVFCYIAVDNTLHLIMMVLFIKYFIIG